MGFNSRTPGGVRRCSLIANCYTKSVSIHAPREGCDFWGDFALNVAVRFQFTHPGRGATSSEEFRGHNTSVSIHAPREGCDPTSDLARVLSSVSIHAPREGCD